MQRNAETLFRHWRLIVIPLFVATFVGLTFGAVQPKSFQSMTTVWFDVPTTAASASSVPVGDSTGVAAEEVSIIKELFSTQQFVQTVATRGPLSAYVATHPNWQTGWAALPGLAKVFGDAAKPLDQRIAAAMSRGVSIVSDGPQVVAISFSGPTAPVAQGTTQAIIDEFSNEVLASRRTQAESNVQYQTALVQAAQQAVASALQALNTYQVAHGATSIGSDTQLASLQTAFDLDTQRYQSEVVALDTATTNLAQVGQNAGFHIIDKPTPAGSPTSRTKLLLLTLLAGLIVGLVIAALLVYVLTTFDRTARRPQDLKRTLGLTVVGSVPLAGQPRRTPHGRRRFFASASDRSAA